MRRPFILSCVACAASTVAAFSFWRELEAERARTAELRAQLVAVARATQAQAVAAVSTPAATRGTPAFRQPGTAANTAVASSPRVVTATKNDDGQAYQRHLLKDPRYVDAMREQRRLTYRLRRDNAMRLFGYSAETADAIIDLDIDQELQWMTSSADGSSGITREVLDAAQRDHDAKLLALLGQDRFDQWQTYMETRGTRMQVDRFRAQLNGIDMLRDDQVEPLITALAAEQKQMREEIQEVGESLGRDGSNADSSRQFRARQLEITAAAHKRMVASAASILSSTQVKRLDDMLANELAQRATQERIESLRQKIGAAPESDAGPD
jgi:hypothetical protein